MNKLILLVFALLVFIQLKSAIGAKPRFAPKYCLRFKFDCSSPEKKGHVCCLFPLPIEGNDLGENSSSQYKVPSVKVGVQKIRPLRIPSRRNGDDSNIDEHSSYGNNRYNVFAQSKDSSSTHAKNNQKRKEASKKKTEEKKRKTTTPKSKIKRPSTRPNRPRKPFICQRLVINCKKNPTHTCCKFEAEEAKIKQEEEDEKQKLEEIEGESNDASIEGQPDIQPEKVDTVISEVEVQSLETAPKPTTLAPKPTIKRKTIDNTPIQTITQNDVEKQLLEA